MSDRNIRKPWSFVEENLKSHGFGHGLKMVKTVPCLPPGTSQLFISQTLLSLKMATLNNSGYGSMPKQCFFLTP
jgi:hypothetical protein